MARLRLAARCRTCDACRTGSRAQVLPALAVRDVAVLPSLQTRLTALALDGQPETHWTCRSSDGRAATYTALIRNGSDGTELSARVLAVWRWFPRLEKRTADAARYERLRWAADALSCCWSMAEETIDPAVPLGSASRSWQFKNQMAFVIGMNNEEFLLYTPAQGDRRYIACAQRTRPELRRNAGAAGTVRWNRILHQASKRSEEVACWADIWDH